MNSSTVDAAKCETDVPRGEERRCHVRLPLSFEFFCKSIDRALGPPWHGECRDLSIEGVQVLTERRFEPQTVLLMELQVPADFPVQSFMARVRWAEQARVGGWLLGCTLVHALTEVELDLLVRESLKNVDISLAKERDTSKSPPSSPQTGRLERVLREAHSTVAPASRRDPAGTPPPYSEGLKRLIARADKDTEEIRLPSRQAARTGLGAGPGSVHPTEESDTQEASARGVESEHLSPTGVKAAPQAEGPGESSKVDVTNAVELSPPLAEPQEDPLVQELLAHLAEQLDGGDLAAARETSLALLEHNPTDADTLSVLAFLHDQLDSPDFVGELRCFTGHRSPVNCVAFSADGQFGYSGSGGEYLDGFFSGGRDRSLRAWELISGQELARFAENGSPVQAIACAPCGTRLVAASRNGDLYLIDAKDISRFRQFAHHRHLMFSAMVAPNGQTIFTGSEDGVARLWDLNGNRISRFEGHTSTITSVAFASDGAWAASASLDRTIRLWDLETGSVLHWFVGHAKGVLSVAISPDGRQVVSGSSDATIRLWDVEGGTEVQALLGHQQGVTSVVFTPDGKRVLSGSSDGSVRLWDVAAGREIVKFMLHEGPVRSVAVSPGGRRALSGSLDNTVRLWGLPS